MKLSLLALALLPAVALGQQTTKTFTLPLSNPVPKTQSFPFSENVIHYQEFLYGPHLTVGLKRGVRIVGLRYQGSVQIGVVLDIEVTMANTPYPNLTGTFARNQSLNKVIVLPRTKLRMSPAGIVIPFKIHWNSDAKRHIVVDIKIWGNGLNKRWNYQGKSTVQSLGRIYNHFALGNANAITPTSSSTTYYSTLETTLLYQEGGAYPFGSGCDGGGRFRPVVSTSGVPMPGLTSYTHHLAKAGSSYPAVLVIGFSNTKFGPNTLPMVMNFLSAPRCKLLVSNDFFIFTTTVGGGMGAGTAKITTPIPPVGSLAGFSFYTQWIVFDRLAPNGIAASGGIRNTIGS